MKKRIIALMGCFVLTLSCFAGCGSTDSASKDAKDADENVTFPYDEFTVKFDANTTPDDLTDDESFTYWTKGWDSKKKTSTVTYKATADAYIHEDDVPIPTRKGYYFAGWQTEPVVTDDDIVNGVSKYQVFFDTKISSIGEDAIKNKSEDEVKARELSQDVNYIKDMKNLTDDGTVTFYARWVEAKEISTEEDLKNIKNDLYGAYVLTNDITLTGDWEPIGMYFTNYEYYNVDWWTYAFRGTLDGQGHTINGLVVNGAERTNPGYDKDKNARWYADGASCSGAAALFGAACKATFTNLTIESPQFNIADEKAYSGDHLYVASLCSFDMGSSLKDITVNNPTIHIAYDDTKLNFAKSLFTTIAGLEAGSWGTTVTGCQVNNAVIDANVTTEQAHGGEVYVGGMLGECYSSIKTSNASAKITLNGQDTSKAKEDTELIVNVGGVGAANAAATTTTTDSDIEVNIAKESGKSSVNVGGFAGAQRYQQVSKCDIKSNIKTDCRLDEKDGTLNVGSVLGRMDMFYATLILKYADEVKCGCTDNTTSVTYNGSPYNVLMADGGYPVVNGEKVTYVAPKDYTDENTGTSYKANLDDVVKAYGSYLPKEGLTKNIMFIEIQ